jgi:hypothetical protein
MTGPRVYLIGLIALFTVVQPARADEPRLYSDSEAVHFAAHFGLGYAATSILYGFAKQGLRMSRTDARIFSSFVVFTCALLRQAVVAAEGNVRPNTAGMVQSMAGIGAATGASIAFDF